MSVYEERSVSVFQRLNYFEVTLKTSLVLLLIILIRVEKLSKPYPRPVLLFQIVAEKFQMGAAKHLFHLGSYQESFHPTLSLEHHPHPNI